MFHFKLFLFYCVSTYVLYILKLSPWFFFPLSFFLLISLFNSLKFAGLSGVLCLSIVLFVTYNTTPTRVLAQTSKNHTTSNQEVTEASSYVTTPGKPSINPDDYPLNKTPCQVSPLYNDQILSWCGLITYYAKQNGLDPNFVAAVIAQESGGNPEPCGGGHMVINGISICGSYAGAIGLMQVMASDGLSKEKYGDMFWDRHTSLELLNPETNIADGTYLLMSKGAATNPREALVRYGGNYNTEQYNFNKYYYADKVMAIYNSHR